MNFEGLMERIDSAQQKVRYSIPVRNSEHAIKAQRTTYAPSLAAI